MKFCSGCGTVKSFSEFSPRRDRPIGVLSRCRECLARVSREYYDRTNGATSRARYQRKHPGARTVGRQRGGTPEERKLMDHHGMWPEDKATEYAIQNGLCYLCKRAAEETWQPSGPYRP